MTKKHGSSTPETMRHSVLTVFRQAWLADRAGLIQILILSSLLGMLPGAQVAITALLVEALLHANQNGAIIRSIMLPLAAMAGASLSLQLLSALQNRATQRSQSLLSASLSGQIINRATLLTLPQAEDSEVQDTLQRALREVNFRPGQMLIHGVQVFTQIFTLGSVGAILWTLDYRIAILALLAPLPVVASQIIQGRRGHALEHSRSQQRRWLNYWQYLASQPDSMKEVVTFGLGPLLRRRHQDLQTDVVTADLKLAQRNLYTSIPLMTLTAALVFAANATAVLTSNNGSQLAGLIAVIQAVGMLQSSTQQLFVGVAQLHVNHLYLRNVQDFLDIALPAPKSNAMLQVPEHLIRGIEFRNVSFRYPGVENYALRNLSVILHPGQVTAVVGLNGAGKSTLSKLISRLYEPTEGMILLDGQPLGLYDPESLRTRTAYVFQDYVHYQLRVGENISIGHLDEQGNPAPDHLAARAALQVDMATYIDALPDGYATQAGKAFDGGIELSGGQWQRLAVARGLIRPATIRVLDEPTSALDAFAEAALITEISQSNSGHITVLIAHRFSAIKHADRILVLDGSRLIEDSTHEKLIQNGGLYEKLYKTQTSVELLPAKPP